LFALLLFIKLKYTLFLWLLYFLALSTVMGAEGYTSSRKRTKISLDLPAHEICDVLEEYHNKYFKEKSDDERAHIDELINQVILALDPSS
jgi:hypothetical protein